MQLTRHTVTLWVLRSFVVLVAFVYGLTWLLSPWLTHVVVKDVLSPMELALTKESHVRYNPFLSSVSIHDLAVMHGKEKIAEIKQAEISVQLFRMIRKKLHVSKFEIDGVYVNLSVSNGEIRFGGYTLPDTEGENESTSVGRADQKPKESFVDGFTFDLPELKIKNVDIDFSFEGQGYPVFFREILLNNVLASQESVSFLHQLQAEMLGGALSLSAIGNSENGAGELKVDLAMNGIALAQLTPLIPEGYGINEGRFDFSTAVKIKQKQSDVEISNEGFKFSISSLEQSLNQETLKVAHAQFNAEALNVQVDDGELNALSLNGSLAIDGAAFVNQNKKITYLSWGLLDLPLIKIKGETNKSLNVDVAITDVGMSNLVVSKQKGALGVPALLELEDFSISALNYSADQLRVGDVVLSGLSSHVYIDEGGEISALVDMSSIGAGVEDNNGGVEEGSPSKSGVGIAEAEGGGIAVGKERETSAMVEVEQDDKAVMPIKIAKISLSEKNRVQFRDFSVSPHYERDIHLDVFEILNINSLSNELSPFRLMGRSEEYASFELSGGVAPFSKKHNFNVAGDVKEISLQSVSPYVRDSLGFELNSGQLDTKIDVRSKDAELDGKIALNIRGLEMTSSSKEASKSLKDQGAVPLNVALAMLKDKRGNIKLDVPVNGSTDDPSFGINSFLMLVTKKAVMSQAKSYLMQAFVPYASVVSVAMVAGEYALKLRFDDLNYTPGQIEIVDGQQEYVQQFIALMKEKEKTQVKICGVATPEDIGRHVETEVKDEALLKAMLSVAKKRGEAFKRYVVEVGGLESSRLLLCQPQIDSGKEVKSRLSISL